MFAAVTSQSPIVQHPAGILAVLRTVLAVIFWLAEHSVFGRLFKIVPAILFCYFVPAALATAGLIPVESELYSFVKTFVLPASLVLLILALDLKGIVKLGPKAVIMLLAGTFGVVIGGPIALLLTGFMLPPDTWQGMSTLAGSWIGGGANFIALGQMAEASEKMISIMVIPDVFVANVWMAVLLCAAGHQKAIDRWTGADTSAIDDLKKRMAEFQERVRRVPSLADLMMILALGLGGSWLSWKISGYLPEITSSAYGTLISGSTWKYLLVTTLGLTMSFTRLRKLEGAGASKIGSVMIYLLIACIGAGATFNNLRENIWFIVAGGIWMCCHVVILLIVARVIRAPIFFVAVGSQANIGGAASAPVVASAFHPALAPVGALLAIVGYVMGTYAGVVCMKVMQRIAESG